MWLLSNRADDLVRRIIHAETGAEIRLKHPDVETGQAMIVLHGVGRDTSEQIIGVYDTIREASAVFDVLCKELHVRDVRTPDLSRFPKVRLTPDELIAALKDTI